MMLMFPSTDKVISLLLGMMVGILGDDYWRLASISTPEYKKPL